MLPTTPVLAALDPCQVQDPAVGSGHLLVDVLRGLDLADQPEVEPETEADQPSVVDDLSRLDWGDEAEPSEEQQAEKARQQTQDFASAGGYTPEMRQRLRELARGRGRQAP